ncbi:MAG: hypothetical protein QMD85_02240 [Candidatus Aenigmarchaeota archaeon]|nr:hypothetical protein [Candidatus Aenigmarchaeota archaeon]
MRKLVAIPLAVLIIIILAMFAYGSSLSESCIKIGSQRTCWKNYAVTINSELCSTNPCTASPDLQKYNAIVDAVSASCESTKQEDFADADLNKEIESALKQITAYNVDARTVCSDPGVLLAKKFYD